MNNQFSPKPNATQIHASNSNGIDKPSRVFEVKYSILIDMRELEATMSEHPTTMIAQRTRRGVAGAGARNGRPAETIYRLVAVEM